MAGRGRAWPKSHVRQMDGPGRGSDEAGAGPRGGGRRQLGQGNRRGPGRSGLVRAVKLTPVQEGSFPFVRIVELSHFVGSDFVLRCGIWKTYQEQHSLAYASHVRCMWIIPARYIHSEDAFNDSVTPNKPRFL